MFSARCGKTTRNSSTNIFTPHQRTKSVSAAPADSMGGE
jgi:hypothetical protein